MVYNTVVYFIPYTPSSNQAFPTGTGVGGTFSAPGVGAALGLDPSRGTLGVPPKPYGISGA